MLGAGNSAGNKIQFSTTFDLGELTTNKTDNTKSLLVITRQVLEGRQMGIVREGMRHSPGGVARKVSLRKGLLS